jgi:DTW domain-containing protein YfiP
MHPKEFKREKAATGHLTHVALANCEIVVDVSFERNARLHALLADPSLFVVLLYPGSRALDLARGEPSAEVLRDRRLVVLVLDATWACARKMLRLSPVLHALPRVALAPSQPSRYRIKRQPQEGCLATIEAVHEVLLALSRDGRDRYDDPALLPALFHRMQDFQIACAADPARANHHHTRAVPDRGTFAPGAAPATKRRAFVRDR